MYSNGSDGSAQAREDEIKRQGRIDLGMTKINQKFAPFNKDFYKQKQQDYMGFAMPQFTTQADKTRRDLAYSLARAGLSDSGAAVQGNAALDKEIGVKQRGIADTALSGANELRNTVEQQRTQLVNQLESTADPNVAATGAYAAASNLHAPTPMQPIGDLFGSFTNSYIANQNAKAYNNMYQQPQNGYTFGGQQGGSERIVQ
jgi:hypothetical protein